MLFLVTGVEFTESANVNGLRFIFFDGRKGPYMYSLEKGLQFIFDCHGEEKVSPKVFHEILCKLMVAKERIPFSISKKEELLHGLDQLKMEKIISENEWVKIRLEIQSI